MLGVADLQMELLEFSDRTQADYRLIHGGSVTSSSLLTCLTKHQNVELRLGEARTIRLKTDEGGECQLLVGWGGTVGPVWDYICHFFLSPYVSHETS